MKSQLISIRRKQALREQDFENAAFISVSELPISLKEAGVGFHSLPRTGELGLVSEHPYSLPVSQHLFAKGKELAWENVVALQQALAAWQVGVASGYTHSTFQKEPGCFSLASG